MIRIMHLLIALMAFAFLTACASTPVVEDSSPELTEEEAVEEGALEEEVKEEVEEVAIEDAEAQNEEPIQFLIQGAIFVDDELHSNPALMTLDERAVQITQTYCVGECDEGQERVLAMDITPTLTEDGEIRLSGTVHHMEELILEFEEILAQGDSTDILIDVDDQVRRVNLTATTVGSLSSLFED